MMSLSQVHLAVGGTMTGKDVMLKGITTDTRTDCTDLLFVALKGDNFDAHDFVSTAIEQGAAAALLENADTAQQLPNVVVDNTYTALTNLAAWRRQQFDIPVMGITGSVGKTTVKEMVGAIFATLGQGVVTVGNLNNEIGVPLTLMRLSEKDLYAVIEIGMNHVGEIERLSNIVKPTVVLINNAGAAHLEGLGSVDVVALAKQEIFSGLSESGTAVLNADDSYYRQWQLASKQFKQISYGLSASADVSAQYQLGELGIELNVMCLDDSFDVSLATLGQHNVMNALAAIAMSKAAGLSNNSIIKGLKNYRPYKGRLNVHCLNELVLIDDTYNANPISMHAAIDVLSRYENSTLIVGDMGELGEATEAAHVELGEYAKENKLQNLFACGDYAKQVISKFDGNKHAFATQGELISFIRSIEVGGACLVKGSRFTQMENIVETIIEMKQQKPELNKERGAY